MDWSNVWSAVGGGVALLIITKMWNDLIPKAKIFTVKGMLIGAAVIALGFAAMPLVIAAKGDNLGSAIAATVLGVMAFSFGISALVALTGWYQFYLLKTRVATIEKHVGLS